MIRFHFSDCSDLITLMAIVDFDKKNKNTQRRQENKQISQKVHKQNVSQSLGQHKFIYFSKRSR